MTARKNRRGFMKTGKGQAEKQSQALVRQVRHVLHDEGFAYVDVPNLAALAVAHNSDLFVSPVGVFTERATAFLSCYDTAFAARFALHRPGWRTPVGIDPRSQTVDGSSNYKLSWFYENIIRFSPFPFVMILDGSGFTPPVIKWGRIRAAESAGKLLIMASVRDLDRWAAAGFPYPGSDDDLWASA
jgi:hypothetical protein